MQSEMTRPIIDIENRPAREVFDIMCDRFKIAMSTAEPVAYYYISRNGVWHFIEAHEFAGETDFKPLYADPPAPSVAVKALEWEAPTTGTDEYSLVANAKIMEFCYEVRRCDGMKSTLTVTRSCDIQPFAWRDTIEGAKAAAQADYEARILSALSVQVQDVATAAEFADRMFKLHGFMLCERHNGKHAVTVTFPNLAEAQQFHGALVDLSRHTTPAAPAKQEG